MKKTSVIVLGVMVCMSAAVAASTTVTPASKMMLQRPSMFEDRFIKLLTSSEQTCFKEKTVECPAIEKSSSDPMFREEMTEGYRCRRRALMECNINVPEFRKKQMEVIRAERKALRK